MNEKARKKERKNCKNKKRKVIHPEDLRSVEIGLHLALTVKL